MHAHGTALAAASQLEPNPAPPTGSVVGLGVTDALRVELQPCQIEGFVGELEELAGPLAETYEHARRHWLEISGLGDQASPPSVIEAEQGLSAAAYVVRALAALRAHVPPGTPTAALALVGPTDLMTTVIAGAAQNAAATLAQSLSESGKRDRRDLERLHRLGAAASAWASTYADCQTIEWFSFDRRWDPVRRV